MANTLIIARYKKAPFGVRAALGAAGTFNNTYSFLVAAWDTHDETDYMNCRLLNYDWGTLTTANSYTEAQGLVLTNDKAVISWAHPHPRAKDHYSVYYQQSATVDLTAIAYKCLPASGLVRGNIDRSATSVIIDGPTSVAETRLLGILSKDLTNNTVTVAGDISLSLTNGVTVALVASGTDTGATTVKALPATVTVDYTDQGKVTTIPLTADIADATLGFLQYDVGPICLLYAGAVSSSITLQQQFITAFSAQILDKSAMSILGHGYEISRIVPFAFSGGKQADVLEIGIAHGGIDMDDLYWLNEWQDKHREIIVINDVDTGNATYPRWYIGHIVSINDVESYKEYNEDIRIQIEIEYERNAYDTNLQWHAISTADAGAAGTGFITIGGYWIDKFYPGRAVRIAGSTGNDGYYSISTSTQTPPSYTSNVTTLYFDQTLPNATDDGRITTYDF